MTEFYIETSRDLSQKLSSVLNDQIVKINCKKNLISNFWNDIYSLDLFEKKKILIENKVCEKYSTNNFDDWFYNFKNRFKSNSGYLSVLWIFDDKSIIIFPKDYLFLILKSDEKLIEEQFKKFLMDSIQDDNFLLIEFLFSHFNIYTNCFFELRSNNDFFCNHQNPR
jgi:hypothetical protein